MEWLDILADIVNPSGIYQNAFRFTAYIAPLSGVLLIMACYVRVVETQLSGHSSLGSWGFLLRDVMGWTLVLTLYSSLVGLIVYYVNDIYVFMNNLGSLDVVIKQMDMFNNLHQQKMNGETPDNFSILSAAYWAMLAESAGSVPGLIVTTATYQISLIAVTILAGFFRLIHAIFFSAAYALGLIVIPLGVSRSLSITSAWKLLWFFVILWPIVEALMMGLFSIPLQEAANAYLAGSEHAAGYDRVNILTLFSVINGIAFLVMFAALVLTAMLVMNSSPLLPMISPVMLVTNKFFSRFKPRMFR